MVLLSEQMAALTKAQATIDALDALVKTLQARLDVYRDVIAAMSGQPVEEPPAKPRHLQLVPEEPKAE
jgi:hypothetical protein